MDYEIINCAIEDITKIVSAYNKDRKYSKDICDALTVALLGYYITFGPEIFKKINQVLEALVIKDFENYEKLKNCRLEDYEKIYGHPNVTIYNQLIVTDGCRWDFRYDAKNKFIGAIPCIYFVKKDFVSNANILIHELSHALEGTSKKYTEDDENVYIKGIPSMTLNKHTGLTKEMVNVGLLELLTAIIENKIIKSLIELDDTRIENETIKKYIKLTRQFKNKNILVESYIDMMAICKDFIDNDAFFELIKKYFYEQEIEMFEEEYNAISDGLNFKVLKVVANSLVRGDIDFLKASTIISKQAKIFNEATGFKPDKRILVLV